MNNGTRPPSETRQKIARIQSSKQLVNASQSLEDVYTLLNRLSSDVLDLYPHIACRTQCNTCCKGTSMPSVSPIEWAQVHDYIMRFYTPEQRSELIERTRAVYNPNKAGFWALHQNIQKTPDLDKLEEVVQILTSLNDTQCPFLVDEKCSVYMSRPAKCRAHGTFLFALNQHIQLHACQSEVDKMETYLVQQGSRSIVMPIWNDFETKIMSDYNPDNAVQTVLPIWIVTHVKDNQLIEEPNLTPDFSLWQGQEL